MDEFLKAVGVPLPIRMMARNSNPRIVISENNGVWTIRTETFFKTMTTTFTPGVEFMDTTPGGQEVQVNSISNFHPKMFAYVFFSSKYVFLDTRYF